MRNSILTRVTELDGNSVVCGATKLEISDISMLSVARPGDICYCDTTDPNHIAGKQNIALICPLDFPEENPTILYIKVLHPKVIFYHISHLFARNSGFNIDEGISGHFEKAAIEVGCEIGENVTIHPGVTVRRNTTIHDGAVIESGCVVGSSGLMWTWDPVRERKVMLSMTGGTTLGVDTYLCANVSIVRGACNQQTAVGDSTMIAPNSAIGHGVNLGRSVHLANGVLLGGDAEVGDLCFLGSGACIQPGLTLAAGSVLGSAATLTRDAMERGVYAGTPARRLGDVADNHNGVPVTQAQLGGPGDRYQAGDQS